MAPGPSMDQSFLDKLRKAIENNYNDEHFGVDELAHEVGISRSQLHRKLQSSHQHSASQMIKVFRLQKALEMLQEKVATVSEISYKVGFSSPSYFNTCFHEYFGYSPGKVRPRKTSKTHGNNKPSIKILFITLAAASVVAVGLYYLIWSPNRAEVSQRLPREISIAIIPFKNLSKDEENMHFADGVTDDLLNQLSGIKGFVVKSRQSSERYRNSEKSTAQIGRELGVEYFIEGSVQRYQDKIRIIVQLIDVETDDHFWSDTYDRELKDIFTVQSEISRQIAKELNTVLSPNEIARIEKGPTGSLEAYNLYQKGRYFWHRRTKEDLNNSISYFNRALELDSAYALAHSGLADAYFIMAVWGMYPKDLGYQKAEELAIEALSIDNDNSEAHATIGAIATWKEFSWGKAEKELQLAISLNPSYATAHQYYAELLDILGRDQEARKHLNYALKLNPFSFVMNALSGMFYYHNDEYVMAIQEAEKVLEIKYYNPSVLRILNCHVKMGLNDEAKDDIKRMVLSNSKVDYSDEIDEKYQECGLEGLVEWFIEWMLKNKQNGYNETSSLNYHVGSLYANIGNLPKSIEYLRRGMEFGDSSMPLINNNPDFEVLRNDPRFIELLKKMNLAD